MEPHQEEAVAEVPQAVAEVPQTVAEVPQVVTQPPTPGPAVEHVGVTSNPGYESPLQQANPYADPKELHSKPMNVDQVEEYVAEIASRMNNLKDEFEAIKTTAQHEAMSMSLRLDQSKEGLGSTRLILESMVYAELDIFGEPDKKYLIIKEPCQSVAHFWRVVWQQRVDTIVLLSTEQDRICKDDEGTMTFEDIKVTTMEPRRFAEYVEYNVSVEHEDVSRYLCIYWYRTWPDGAAPMSVPALLEFRNNVRKRDVAVSGPTLVTCSETVGRSGTYVAIDYLLDQAKAEGRVDVFRYLVHIHKHINNLIQTMEQYVLIYRVIIEFLLTGDTSVTTREFPIKCQDILDNRAHLQYQILLRLIPEQSERTVGAQQTKNMAKNRFKGILPFDRLRPTLLTVVEDTNEYINAVFVDMYQKYHGYIATQAPMIETAPDIWRLLYDHTSSVVIMLNEAHANYQDYPVYWPTVPSMALKIGPLTVTFVDSTGQGAINMITLMVTNSKKKNDLPLEVKIYQLLDWPDGQDVPNSISSFLFLLNLVRSWQAQYREGPVTVQCRDGASKCGLVCAASFILDRIDTDRHVDIFQAVRRIRASRPQFIPTEEQFRFLHTMTAEYLRMRKRHSHK